ncbi:K+/H+ antiporter [Kroppenstedtia guangzhouensis]|uniref:K+/H+ antiporter n=1 Tax=Kroppenstedtia guangzhouensis TaxID=1274356 RepID=A0ABQ1GBD0_9BACL|nr:potassium/proton antiporter [Kroppenstedtia guangzhouensis]GGA40357.1 K+/H+ antiporter [Kroppenstedtia guangzhouensis]
MLPFSPDSFVLFTALLLVVGVLTTKVSSRMGVPALVLFIAVGMLVGHFFYFDNAELAQFFGVLALIIILFDGGTQTQWTDIKQVKWESLTLATIGVLITTAIIGGFAALILDVSLFEGLLFGAIVGSTDAAAVFMVLGSKSIQRKMRSILEAESGSNDPMAVFLTISLIEVIMGNQANIWTFIGSFFWQMALGLLLGYVLGRIAVWLINRIHLEAGGLYPVLTIGLGLLIYGLVAAIGGSGFLAVYVAGLVIGNSEISNRYSTLRFNEGFAWMMQILMFILLGLLVFPDQVIQVVIPGFSLSLLLMFVARPIGVLICTAFFKMTWKERTFLSWAGLRGAVPIILATFPMLAGYEQSQLFFNVIFFVVVSSALIQGLTISPLAQYLNLAEDEKNTTSYSLELVSIRRANADIIELSIQEDSPIVGKAIRALQLPKDTLINAIIRDDQVITPKGKTVIEEGDVLFVLVSKENSASLKKQMLGSQPTG